MRHKLLNGLAPAQFLRRHWQKKPLLSRLALPSAASALTRSDLFELAQHPETEARLIVRKGKQWQVFHGPFRKNDFSKLPRRNWTLLVQGVNLVHPQAGELLAPFSFIPYARLDDLMVSYAPPGGGVGPHFDSYDVFLVQGEGKRNWRISNQRDLSLVENAPLKILRNFRAMDEWTLDPGDMLYLPPRWAHDGVAVTPCITYSVGFRAPSAQDLCNRFFDFLADHLDVWEHYADPQLRATHRPARIDSQMTRKLLNLLRHARWSRADMLNFIGTDLSTPNPHIMFSAPRRSLPRSAFKRAVNMHGLRLDPKSILLYDDRAFYINGNRLQPPAGCTTLLQRLADRRILTGIRTLSAAALNTLYDWYRAGYLHPGAYAP